MCGRHRFGSACEELRPGNDSAVPPTVVFDLDKVLLGGDATTLFLHGQLRRRPVRGLAVLAAAPLLLPAAAVPSLRPLGARALTPLAGGGGGEPGGDPGGRGHPPGPAPQPPAPGPPAHAR